MRWFRQHSLLVAYVLIIAVAVVGFVSVQREAALREREHCQATRDNRVVLRSVVEQVGAEGGGLNLTGLPEFEALTPETQDYLVALERLAARSSSSERFRERAIALLDVPQC
jgi:hypothetical protein